MLLNIKYVISFTLIGQRTITTCSPPTCGTAAKLKRKAMASVSWLHVRTRVRRGPWRNRQTKPTTKTTEAVHLEDLLQTWVRPGTWLTPSSPDFQGLARAHQTLWRTGYLLCILEQRHLGLFLPGIFCGIMRAKFRAHSYDQYPNWARLTLQSSVCLTRINKHCVPCSDVVHLDCLEEVYGSVQLVWSLTVPEHRTRTLWCQNKSTETIFNSFKNLG